VYSFPEPPYFLLVAGLLASLASGAAFEAVLKLSVKEWSKNRSTRSLANMRGLQLFLPFIGIAGGACVFLSSGMEIFGFTSKLAYLISFPLTAFIAWLVWWQLGKILVQLDQGGSQALDLDSFG
jgi:formate hydrogenlyase subunit 3/multisubunit Na+/H+ antiporter MnhD subunit